MCGISINGLHSTWIKTLFLICYIYIFFSLKFEAISVGWHKAEALLRVNPI